MKYRRGDLYTLWRSLPDKAQFPELLALDVDVASVPYRSVTPQDGEDIVALTKRAYGEADAYWLLMAVNSILSPFEPLSGNVIVPDGSSLDGLYQAALAEAG